MSSEYRVAGIDVHKKMLAVVVTDVAAPGEWDWERRTFGTLDSDLRELAACVNGGAIIDHKAARERRFVAVEK